jgi:hypothetical protein
MRRNTFISAFIIAITFLFISCKDTSQKSIPVARAEQIKISDLKTVLTKLQNRQLEFDFFGITSNAVDCIYFVPDGILFAVEFEVMGEDQKPWLDELKKFAQQNNFSASMTTYNNRPNYKSTEPAPVLHIETKSNLEQTAAIGKKIMTEVFKNVEQTKYDVVP